VLEPHALLVTPDSCGRLADITAHFPALRIYRGTGEKALHEITGYTMHSGAIALGLGLGLRHDDGTIGERAARARCAGRHGRHHADRQRGRDLPQRREHGYAVIAGEDTPDAVNLSSFAPPSLNVLIASAVILHHLLA
jgi:hypothetical protein